MVVALEPAGQVVGIATKPPVFSLRAGRRYIYCQATDETKGGDPRAGPEARREEAMATTTARTRTEEALDDIVLYCINRILSEASPDKLDSHGDPGHGAEHDTKDGGEPSRPNPLPDRGLRPGAPERE